MKLDKHFKDIWNSARQRFCHAVGCHKDLHIGITVCFQCVGNFVQFISDFPFGLLYLRFQRFTLLTLEDALCFGSYCFRSGSTLSCKCLISFALSCNLIIRLRIWRNSAISISSVGLGGILCSRIRFCRKPLPCSRICGTGWEANHCHG